MTTGTTYSEQRDAMNRDMATRGPAELLNGFAAAAARLDAVDFAGRALRVGDRAPDFTLPDHRGKAVQLSALLRYGPVVLIFYRGQWCPYCNLQLRAFQARFDEFARYRAQLVAVSPQTPDLSLAMVDQNELAFTVLSDVGAHVIERYGLRYEVDRATRALLETAGNDLSTYNGGGGWVLPAVATFVVGTAGRVRYANVRGNWTERSEPSEVLEVLGTRP
jgi:peroxiredoxin